MARDYCQIKVSIWHDEDFTALSGDAQRLYMYLCSQPKLDMAGITPWRPRLVARSASDWTEGTVEAALSELEEEVYVLLDEDTDELLVRSFIRNDELLKSPNLTKAMVKAWKSADSTILRGVVAHEVSRLGDEDPSLRGLEHCEELFSQPLIDPRENPFGKGSRKGSRKGCRTPAPTPTPTPAPATAGDSRFDEFWAAFPPERKSNKPGCRKKFAQAVKSVDPERIIAAAAAYRDDPNRDPAFTVNPHRWLNEERWDAGPLPSKVNASDQRLHAGIQLAQRAAQHATDPNPFALEA